MSGVGVSPGVREECRRIQAAGDDADLTGIMPTRKQPLTDGVDLYADQRAARALGDAALIAAMRQNDPIAWAEFERRFRPGLDAFCARIRLAEWQRDECITDVLDDAAIKLTRGDIALPGHLSGYLVRAVRNRAFSMMRGTARRERHYHDAATLADGEFVVRSVCSEQVLRDASGEMLGSTSSSDLSDRGTDAVVDEAVVVRRLARELMSELTDEEQRIVVWVAESVPYREIASWLGSSYDATSKRIWRLLKRLRDAAAARAEQFSDDERNVLRRYFARRGQ